MDSFGRKLFSFGRSKANAKNANKVLQQKDKQQELAQFSSDNFNVQQYIGDYYRKTTPDKAPEHIDKLQGLLNHTNDLLKSYVYDNYNAFVHASNRTLVVENDVVFLHSLINNLKLSINNLPNETISGDPATKQSISQFDEINLFGGKSTQSNSFYLAGPDAKNDANNSNIGLLGIEGLHDKNNIVKIQILGHPDRHLRGLSNGDDDSDDDSSVSYLRKKYLQKGKDSKKGGDLEIVNLIELAEDLRSLLYERRLGEAVNLVEVFVLLGVIPPILQFNQTAIDHESTTFQLDQKNSKFTLEENAENNVNPKKHYTSYDYIDTEINPSQSMLNAADKVNKKEITTSVALNATHLRHRTQMQQHIMHENVSQLVNPPQFFEPVISTPALNLTTSDTYNRNFYSRQTQTTTRQLLLNNDSDVLDKPRALEFQGQDVYNDGQYTFQPVLQMPQYRMKFANQKKLPGELDGDDTTDGSGGRSARSPANNQQCLDHQQVEALCPQPRLFSSMFGFGKQAPATTWRLTHQQESINRQRSGSGSNGSSGGGSNNTKQSNNNNNAPDYNNITINKNLLVKNTNITHHYTKQTDLSAHVGSLVTTLTTILLDEMTDFVGTSWEQDTRVHLLCRLNQHHLALHRYLALQSKHLHEQLRKAKYKGDLHIFTLSICHIVFGAIQQTLQEVKRLFATPYGNSIQHNTGQINTFKNALNSYKNNNGKDNTNSNHKKSKDNNNITIATYPADGPQTTGRVASLLTDEQLGIPLNATPCVLRDDLLAHLSTWMLLEITRLGRFIDLQILQQDDKFENFPLCINAVYQASLETEQVLGVTTCNVLVRCLHQSILGTINKIVTRLDEQIMENVARDDWEPVPFNFTLPPISLQTPRDLLSPDCLEMIDNNAKVQKAREQREMELLEWKEKVRQARRMQKEGTTAGTSGGMMTKTNFLKETIQEGSDEELSKIDTTTKKKTGFGASSAAAAGKDKDNSDSESDEELSRLNKKFGTKKSPTSSTTTETKETSKAGSSSKTTTTTVTTSSSTSGGIVTKKDGTVVMPPPPKWVTEGIDPDEDYIHHKIRLYVSHSSVYMYQVLLTFTKQLLSVLLCPIWRVSQQSVETVAIQVLCNCVENATKALTSVIRKHLATLWAPLPPDYAEFATAMTNSAGQGAKVLVQKMEKIKEENLAKEQGTWKPNEKSNMQLKAFMPAKLDGDKKPTSTLAYKQDLGENNSKDINNNDKDGNNNSSGNTTNTLIERKTNITKGIEFKLPSQIELKKEFKPLSELQLAVVLNSLSFIAHYVFPYLSLLMSVNLCKPIPELLSQCYKQRECTSQALQWVWKKKAQFLVRGRWYGQQTAQYRELFEKQKQLLKQKKLEDLDEAQLSSLLPPPTYKETFDNINTLHTQFNGALFWCDSTDINDRYQSMLDFPDKPSQDSITTYMWNLLTHIYQQWLSYGQVFTPTQTRTLLLALTEEICVNLQQQTGWEGLTPDKKAAQYMTSDIKTMLYFCYSLFGVSDKIKTCREVILRRITNLYGQKYAKDRPEIYFPPRVEGKVTKDPQHMARPQEQQVLANLLKDPKFIEQRTKEIDSGQDYYKIVSKIVLDHCKKMLSKSTNYNCMVSPDV